MSVLLITLNRKVPTAKYREYEYTIGLNEIFNTPHGEEEIEIGRVCLRKIAEETLETHSRLMKSMHGHGWGVLLYLGAIRVAQAEGFSVVSAKFDDMTEKAKRLWTSSSLKSLFKISFKDGRFWVS